MPCEGPPPGPGSGKCLWAESLSGHRALLIRLSSLEGHSLCHLLSCFLAVDSAGQVWHWLFSMVRSRSPTLQGEVELENMMCSLCGSQRRTWGSFGRRAGVGKVLGLGDMASSLIVSPEWDCSHVHSHSHVPEFEVLNWPSIFLLLPLQSVLQTAASMIFPNGKLHGVASLLKILWFPVDLRIESTLGLRGPVSPGLMYPSSIFSQHFPLSHSKARSNYSLFLNTAILFILASEFLLSCFFPHFVLLLPVYQVSALMPFPMECHPDV